MESMECNAVEWNGMDAFWIILVILVILALLAILGHLFVNKMTTIGAGQKQSEQIEEFK